MAKKASLILMLLAALVVFTACGGGSSSGSNSSNSGEVDPFDPAIFNVEEGGIVLHYHVDTSVYGTNHITEVDIENQLPEDDIRSCLTYEVEEDEELYLSVGSEATICVDAPDEFWEDHTLTAESTTITVPPVPCATLSGKLRTDDLINGLLPEMQKTFDTLNGRNYYYSLGDTGKLEDVVDLQNIIINDEYLIYAPTTVPVGDPESEDGSETRYAELGALVIAYNENLELVPLVLFLSCDEAGDHYFYNNDDHMIPLTDGLDWLTTSDPDYDKPWVQDLPTSDVYIAIDGYAYNIGEMLYKYNCSTGELTKVSE